MESTRARPDLSIVIVTWNAAPFLGPCLDALERALASIGHEIIVVDNASTDGTLSLLRARGFQEHSAPHEDGRSRRVMVVNRDNQGFARANNQGLALAQAPFVLFLNPDTEVTPSGVAEMLTYLQAHPDVVAVGPKLVKPDGTIQGGAAGHEPSVRTVFNYSLGLYLLSPQRFPALWLARRQYQTHQPIPVDWVSGAALMTRTDDARAVGGWPESYFLYFEDIAFCRRLRRRGKIMCLPTAEVVHHIGQSVHTQGSRGIERNVLGLDREYRARYGRFTVAFLHLLGALAFGIRWGAAVLLRTRVPKGHSAPARLLWRTCALSSLRCAWRALAQHSTRREKLVRS